MRKTLQHILHTLSHRNPWLTFLPFLALYTLYALNVTPHDTLILDEGRYWGFAENLLQGHFHYTEGYQFLWSGPGYPLLLVPFVAANSPLWILKVLNAILLYSSVVLFFKLLRLYISPKRALLGALLFACYYPMYEVGLPYVMTEAWSMFLTVAPAYLICKAFRFKDYRWQTLLLPAFLLGMLALTKVIFGYVLLAMILICLAVWLIRKRSRRMLQMTKIFTFAMAFCLPYLIYTYSLTGKPFYWGNAGGLQLYWMSTPYEDELGDWHVPTLEENPLLQQNHGAFFAEIEHLGPVEKDEALKKKAIEHIKAHPKKYIYNWIANMGRTFFSHPLSFLKPSNGLFPYLLPNIFLIVFAALMAIPTIRYYKKFPLEILVLLTFSLVYLGGISLMSSYPRFLFMIVPIWMLWIAWGLHRFVKVSFGNTPEAILPQPENPAQ
jgi:hypothetical protein